MQIQLKSEISPGCTLQFGPNPCRQETTVPLTAVNQSGSLHGWEKEKEF